MLRKKFVQFAIRIIRVLFFPFVYAILADMSRQRITSLFIVFVTAAVLAACAPSVQTPTLVPTRVSTSASPYDGDWKGKGTAQDGREITVIFTIKEGAVTSFVYNYMGALGLECTGIDHSLIPPESQPRVQNNSFSQKFGDDLTADATFTSSDSASGHISIVWKGRANCQTSLQADWTATKQQAVQTTTAAPVTSTWCGKNVNCRDLIFQLLIFGLVNGAILALNAIGVTVIYNTVRTLNLAHGDVFALTSAFVTSTINIIGLNLNWPAPTRVLVLVSVLIASVGFGALLSLGVEEAAFRPFRGRSKLAPVIASLGISFILYQGALVWRTYQKSFIRGEHRSVPGLPEVPTDGIPNFLPLGNLLHGKVVLQASDVFVWVAAILFVVVTTYILARTRLGKSIRAVAQNEDLAQMVGVNRDGAIRRAFALGGALAGAAAFVFAMYYSRPFGKDGAESGLFAFAAALLGGVGSPVGALLSGLLLGVVGSFSDYFLTGSWTPVLLLGLLAALLVWRRGGFAGGDGQTEQVAARDSVVLTAPVQGPRAKRFLIALLI